MQISKPNNLIKEGNIYQLGEHRLLCGNCTDKDRVRELIGKEKINLIVTDPPYGISYVQSKSGFKQNIAKPKNIQNDQFQSEAEYISFSKKWLSTVLEDLNNKNSIYIFNCDKMIFALHKAMKELNIYFSQLLIWVKNQAIIGRKDYLPQHELIAYGWFGTHKFAKSKDKSVVFYPKPNKSKLHPTMKPIGLLRRIILNSSRLHNVVYDPFGGSGSTLIACEQTKRKCLMVELDLEYCQTIINRFEKLTNIKAKKINQVYERKA